MTACSRALHPRSDVEPSHLPCEKHGKRFNGDDAYVGPPSTSTIEGKDDRSIEVWVLNPVVSPSEESMLSWSDRKDQTKGRMLSFNYGKDLNWSAVTHWDGTGLSWGDASAMPMESQWHHLAYTYDGTTALVFADGVKKAEKDVMLDTKGGFSINIAAQRNGSGFEQHGSLAIAVVRVHSGALTPAEVKSNYDLEKARFD
ncbi:MAG: LamG domain-containing protein [Byssovorax sp.]